MKSVGPEAPRRRRTLSRALALVLATALAAGCSAGSHATDTVSGWFGAGAKTDKKAGRVLYAAADGPNVYDAPKGSAKSVGRLRPNEKVTFTKEKDGYTYVEARSGALKGWVLNSKLDWRLPASAGTGRAQPASE